MSHHEPMPPRERAIIWLTLLVFLGLFFGLVGYQDYCASTAQIRNLAGRAK